MENVAACAADEEEFHSGLGTSLLRLEKHGLLAVTFRARTGLVRSRKRRIRGHVLGHTGRLSDRVVQHVAVDTRGLGRLAVLAGATGKHELVSHDVLARVQHIAAFAAEPKGNLLEGLFVASAIAGAGDAAAG